MKTSRITEHLRIAGVAAALGVSLAGCSEQTPAARGAAVFDTCVPCHGSNGQGNQVLGAPAIAGLPMWYVRSQLENFENGVRGANPMDTVGIRMRSMALSLDLPGDLEAVAEHVASMPRTNPAPTLPGDPQNGQTVYATCAACHGPTARGNPQLGAPPLRGQSDWYLAAQFRKFRRGWRGTHPDDQWGATMYPQSQMFSDATIRDVLAYIQTLQ